MADVRRIYIDSCGFIDIVNVSVKTKMETDRENDVWHLKRLLEATRDREVEVYTSTLTIAECVHVGEKDISAAVKSAFTTLLTSGQYVRLVQTAPFIGEDARDLRWKHGISLKGADSIHVASALDRKCEEMLTTDGRLLRLGIHFDKLEKLGLRVMAARDTKCLPDKYRQLGLIDDKQDAGTNRPGSDMH